MAPIAESWLPQFDALTGTLALPMWLAGTLLLVFALLCILVFGIVDFYGRAGSCVRYALLILAAGIASAFAAGLPADETAAVLEGKLRELTLRAIKEPSMACLNSFLPEAAQPACERIVFASAENISQAVSNSTEKLSFLAEGLSYATRFNPSYEKKLHSIRREVEVDRFGIFAHVIKNLGYCPAEEHCSSFMWVQDRSQLSQNIAVDRYRSNVAKYSP